MKFTSRNSGLRPAPAGDFLVKYLGALVVDDTEFGPPKEKKLAQIMPKSMII